MYLESAYKANHFHVSIIIKILFLELWLLSDELHFTFTLFPKNCLKLRFFLGVFVFALLFDLIGILQQDGR